MCELEAVLQMDFLRPIEELDMLGDYWLTLLNDELAVRLTLPLLTMLDLLEFCMDGWASVLLVYFLVVPVEVSVFPYLLILVCCF